MEIPKVDYSDLVSALAAQISKTSQNYNSPTYYFINGRLIRSHDYLLSRNPEYEGDLNSLSRDAARILLANILFRVAGRLTLPNDLADDGSGKDKILNIGLESVMVLTAQKKLGL